MWRSTQDSTIMEIGAVTCGRMVCVAARKGQELVPYGSIAATLPQMLKATLSQHSISF